MLQAGVPWARRLQSVAEQLAGRHALRHGHGAATRVNSSAAAAAPGTHFDYLVIGAGSGGMASARRAADVYGANVAIVEGARQGATDTRNL